MAIRRGRPPGRGEDRGVQGVGRALLTPAALALICTGFAEGPEHNRAPGRPRTRRLAGR
ncbi:hypothetical protein OG417_26325 [Actinoallomurus sp. NBC_01490]|uniref:hypothetical protein n=1 Tax=Actinoallomurus sp. NBC_01490 TaxID=2903557 RepID=UPI002E344F1E|nr:hypothetical protein [Actinoallomurus sp. NBC_01490]